METDQLSNITRAPSEMKTPDPSPRLGLALVFTNVAAAELVVTRR